MVTSYQLVFPTENILKRFKKFQKRLTEKERQDITEAVLALKENPRPQGKTWRKLSNPVIFFQWLTNYRIRIGHYRVLYDIDDERKKIILLGIRRRNEGTYE